MATPIGIFDSGYGGLTVLREIRKSLPAYDFIYLGDNLRAPYGTKDFDTVYQYTLEAVRWFFGQGCNLVILACNTASAKALRTIQHNDLSDFGVEKRVLGVIRPTAEVIGNLTKTGHVGVLGTPGTIASDSYKIEIGKFFPEVKVVQHACAQWVNIVEEEKIKTELARFEVEKEMESLLKQDEDIDAILLGCTHYPLLLPLIENFSGDNIRIITQGEIVAASLAHYLQRHPLMNETCSKNGNVNFYTTGSTTNFNEHASSFYGEKIQSSQALLKDV